LRARCLAALLLALAVVSFVAAANAAPVANFSAYRLSGGAEPTVLLDASASTDPDGRIVSYQWVFGDGTSGSGIEAEHTFPSVDRYSVRLMTIDDGGSWHMITRTIDVSALPSRESGSVSVDSARQDATALVATSDVPTGTGVGQRAPDFALPDLEGSTVHLSDFRGEVILLEFWKSTCPTCQTSAARLEALRRQYETEGLVIILLDLGESASTVARYMTSYGYGGFVVVLESRGFFSPIAEMYNISGTPRLVLIDRSGVIRHNGSASALSDELVLDWL
jgi:thiol-disulfide isomerase/thioredoxin